jgi:hypothetical protein
VLLSAEGDGGLVVVGVGNWVKQCSVGAGT